MDLIGLPTDAQADYYLDYGILVFPQYTRPTSYISQGRVTAEFWERVKNAVQHPRHAHVADLEHPYITTEEYAVVKALQNTYPNLQTDWFYVPRVINKNNVTIPEELMVYEECSEEEDEEEGKETTPSSE